MMLPIPFLKLFQCTFLNKRRKTCWCVLGKERFLLEENICKFKLHVHIALLLKMLILLLKKLTHPHTCGWFIDHFVQVMYILFLCQNYACIIYILAHRNTHKSSTTYCRVLLLPVPSEATANTGKPGGDFPPSPRTSPHRGKPPRSRRGNVHCGRLPPAGTRGRARSGGTGLRLPGQVFPPCGWDAGSGFCLRGARAFHRSMRVSEWYYWI